MGHPTPIEWTDATWNPVGGCEVISPGCIGCYAMALARDPKLINHSLYSTTTMLVRQRPVWNGRLTVLADDHPSWEWPLRWQGAAKPVLGAGKPSLIFVGDMSDLFHKDRPIEVIDRVIAIVMLSHHIGQLLTKRTDVMARYFLDPGLPARLAATMQTIVARTGWHGPAVLRPSALWLGFSAERQREMDQRWADMREVAEAGWQIFVSAEPLIERVVLPFDLMRLKRKPWIIAGGESSNKAQPDPRPAHPDWFRFLRDQCGAEGVPFFFKQWGDWAFDGQLRANGKLIAGGPGADGKERLGKKFAGRRLDDVEHNAFPEAA